jgi:hypothetical protein
MRHRRRVRKIEARYFGRVTNQPPPPAPVTPDAVKKSLEQFGRWLVRAFEWLEEHDDDIRDFLEKSKRHARGPWQYLLDLVDTSTSVTIILSLEAKERLAARPESQRALEDAISEILERGLHEPALLDEVRTAVGAAALPKPQEKQLLAGIAEFEAHEYEVAVPLLINPLEGAFWHLADARSLVVRNRRGKWEINDGSNRQLDSVEALFKLQGMNLDESARRFLRGLVYGGTGNTFRHGTAEEGFRLRALCLFVSLIAWLETAGQLNAKRTVMAALRRESDARAAAPPESPPAPSAPSNPDKN